MKTTPKVGVDLSSISRPGGISDRRIAQGLLRGLLEIADGLECGVVVAVNNRLDLPASLPANLEAVTFRPQPRLLANNLSLRSAYDAADVRAGLYHHFAPVRGGSEGVVCLMHDVAALSHPGLFPGRERAWSRLRMPFARQANLVLTVSEVSRQGLRRFGVPTGTPIEVIEWGTDTEVIPAESAKGIESGKLLVVGRVMRHKGAHQVARAARLNAGSDGGKVVFAGPIIDTDIVEIFESADCLFLGAVSDAELEQLYKDCAAVLLLSKVEGYGMPLAEALSRGCRVMARDLPVFREAARGDSTVLWVDEKSDEELSAQLQSAVAMGRPSGGYRRPTQTWAQAAADLITVLLSAAAETARQS